MRLIPAAIAVITLLSACVGPGPTEPNPALGQGEFAAAPPALGGRTVEERKARRAYYRGPRGHEF